MLRSCLSIYTTLPPLMRTHWRQNNWTTTASAHRYLFIFMCQNVSLVNTMISYGRSRGDFSISFSKFSLHFGLLFVSLPFGKSEQEQNKKQKRNVNSSGKKVSTFVECELRFIDKDYGKFTSQSDGDKCPFRRIRALKMVADALTKGRIKWRIISTDETKNGISVLLLRFVQQNWNRTNHWK